MCLGAWGKIFTCLKVTESCSPKLINLDKDQGHDEVHHGSVKLQTQVGGTNMENAAQNSLHDSRSTRKLPRKTNLKDHGKSHCVEDTILLR